MLETPDPQEAVEKLVRGANRAGGIDNITAVILDFADDGGGPGATKQSAMPQQPTTERPIPPAAPPNRSDVTIVGAPIPEPPPEASASSSPRGGPRTARIGRAGAADPEAHVRSGHAGSGGRWGSGPA